MCFIVYTLAVKSISIQKFIVIFMVLVVHVLVKPADRGKKDALENLKREIAILKKVDHPNVVKLHEVSFIISKQE